MSMELELFGELVQVFTAYTLCVFIAPYIVFHKYLCEKSMAEKFILCTLIGNFYIINIVFLIFLTGIPGKLSLYFFTLLPAFAVWRQINHPGIKRYFTFLYVAFSRLFLGEAKIHTIWTLLSRQPVRWLKKTSRAIVSHAIHHIFEWGLLLGFLAFNAWYYGYHVITRFSYGASDLPVHHYWINEMCDGIIFCKGVYPFGFHNVVYFLHTFFGLETVSIMNAFGVTQTIYIYLMLYLLLRKICRSKYTPIFGVFLFTLPNLFNQYAIWRYQCSLPQEFGMVFLYPCAYFLIQFFERKREEINREKELKNAGKLYTWLEQYQIRPSTKSLVFFAMSFSMTLAAHFYITIIAVFLCLAVALAYTPIVFHPRYFWSIALAGILSLVCAIAPLGIAFAQGTPLQGSLTWALEVMDKSSKTNQFHKPEDDTTNVTDTSSTKDSINTPTSAPTDNSQPVMEDNLISPPTQASTSVEPVPDEPALMEKITQKIQEIPSLVIALAQKLYEKFKSFNEIVTIFLCNVCNGIEITTTIVYAMEGLLAFSFLAICIRRKFYYRNLLFIGFYVFFMTILCCSEKLNLPSLMELTRSCIFMAYAVPLLGACTIDVCYTVICRPFKYHRSTELLPVTLTVALTFLTVSNNYVKPLTIVSSVQTSGEVHCNYEIMANYPDKSWTVVTTTNSLQVVRDYGWHMELCTFLEKMKDYDATTTVTIPTKYVFFYIEKKPVALGYYGLVTNPVLDAGHVSKGVAAQEPYYGGGSVYNVPNRYILESKFYYWAKAFEQKYPQEFQVYYEDDSFICYRMIQNEYNLYNFAIDYGFN